MEKEKLIIIGAGGHAKVVIDVIDKAKYEIVGILDKDETFIGNDVCGVPIIGTDVQADIFFRQGIQNAVIAIGHLGDVTIRSQIYAQLCEIGFELPTFIHESAVVSKYASLGKGNVVFPKAVINAGAKICDNTIINTGVIIEHDSVVEDNAHLSPGSVVCGGCRIGKNVLIGAGSTIIQGIHIDQDTVVGAGSVVTHSIGCKKVAYGVPARVMKEKK